MHKPGPGIPHLRAAVGLKVDGRDGASGPVSIRANAARLAAVVILSGCTTGLVPPVSEGLELACDAAQLRIAWSVPARLASIEVIGPDGIPLMDEALEVPPDQPAEPFESTYEWPRNAVTPSGDYDVTFVVDGRRTEHVVTCP